MHSYFYYITLKDEYIYIYYFDSFKLNNFKVNDIESYKNLTTILSKTSRTIKPEGVLFSHSTT